MLYIPRWFRNFVTKLFRRKPVVAPPPPPPPPLEVAPPPPPPSFQLPAANRSQRRKLERLRRRHDKFVTPQGPQPVKQTRQPTQHIKPQPQPQPSAPEPVDDNDYTIADEHHEDRTGPRVLYEESEIYGEFNFRDTILQQLERYFVYLERMKKYDWSSYALYRQIGATVVPYVACGSHDRKKDKEDFDPKEPVPALPEWFHKTRPAFGCYVYGADPETEKYELEAKSKKEPKSKVWVPKFMYFTKYELAPPTMQRVNDGDTYKMTVWWDRPFDPKTKIKYGRPQEFGIFVSRDGKTVRALKEIKTRWVSVEAKRKNDRFHIPQRAWSIPDDFEAWAKSRGETAQHMLTDMFVRSAIRHEWAQYSMVRVAASKGDMTAVFGVNVRRMSYFFQDRDIHLTEHGGRKKVFHMVRPHTRKDGTAIKAHFRGEREFTWAGYNISITIPGRDHFMLDEFNVGVIDQHWFEKGEKYVDEAEVGRRLADDIRRGVGGLK